MEGARLCSHVRGLEHGEQSDRQRWRGLQVQGQCYTSIDVIVVVIVHVLVLVVVHCRRCGGDSDRLWLLAQVWDSLGRLLFQSSPSEHVITSVAWAPNGENFAVGSYDMVRVCDKAGVRSVPAAPCFVVPVSSPLLSADPCCAAASQWSFGREKPDTGSLLALSWSSDGTVVAGGGGSGAVMFAELIGTQLQWQNYEVCLHC